MTSFSKALDVVFVSYCPISPTIVRFFSTGNLLLVIRFGSFGKEHGNVKAKSKKEKEKTKTEAQGKHPKSEPDSKFLSFMSLKQNKIEFTFRFFGNSP